MRGTSEYAVEISCAGGNEQGMISGVLQGRGERYGTVTRQLTVSAKHCHGILEM